MTNIVSLADYKQSKNLKQVLDLLDFEIPKKIQTTKSGSIDEVTALEWQVLFNLLGVGHIKVKELEPSKLKSILKPLNELVQELKNFAITKKDSDLNDYAKAVFSTTPGDSLKIELPEKVKKIFN